METQHPKGDKMPDPQGPDEVPPQEPKEEGLPEGGEEDTPSPDPEGLDRQARKKAAPMKGTDREDLFGSPSDVAPLRSVR